MNAPERSLSFLLDEDAGEVKCVYTADTKVLWRLDAHVGFVAGNDRFFGATNLTIVSRICTFP